MPNREPVDPMKAATLFCVILVALCLSVPAADRKSDPETATAKCRQLQLALVEERAKAIREDPDIARLHNEILRLYRELDRALLAKPAIAKLQAELKEAREASRTADERKPSIGRSTQ